MNRREIFCPIMHRSSPSSSHPQSAPGGGKHIKVRASRRRSSNLHILATLLGSGIKFQGNRDLQIGQWTTLIILGHSRWHSHQARISFLLEQAVELKNKLSTPNSAISQIVIDLFHDEKDLLDKLTRQIEKAVQNAGFENC